MTDELTKQSITIPTAIPTMLVIDWVDGVNNISVQIMRKVDRHIYDPIHKVFSLESTVAGEGLIALVRDTGIRTAYQYVEVVTPTSVFQDGAYSVYYFDQNTVLLETVGFFVYQGIPFQNFDFPYLSLIPSANDIAVAMVVKLMDNTTVTLHKIANTPGLAFNKILGTA